MPWSTCTRRRCSWGRRRAALASTSPDNVCSRLPLLLPVSGGGRRPGNSCAAAYRPALAGGSQACQQKQQLLRCDDAVYQGALLLLLRFFFLHPEAGHRSLAGVQQPFLSQLVGWPRVQRAVARGLLDQQQHRYTSRRRRSIVSDFRLLRLRPLALRSTSIFVDSVFFTSRRRSIAQ